MKQEMKKKGKKILYTRLNNFIISIAITIIFSFVNVGVVYVLILCLNDGKMAVFLLNLDQKDIKNTTEQQ